MGLQAGALVKQSKPAPGGRVLVGDDLGVWLRLGTDGVAETVKVWKPHGATPTDCMGYLFGLSDLIGHGQRRKQTTHHLDHFTISMH